MTSSIGRYQIEKQVGEGGMATVFLATDPMMKRTVAIKVLPRQFLSQEHFRARFQREAEVIARLEHPHIVPVYDYGEHEGQPFLVMRYMTGGSLADRLRRGRLPLADTARIVASLASALDKAHTTGIVHRDLKPGNILLDSEGEPYIADFGIAKLMEASIAFTATGGFMGTPIYMSPEQWRGDKELDGRSDIYALGCMTFEMLSGQLPFEANIIEQLMYKHLNAPVPYITERVSSLPSACDEVLQRAMNKDRDQRYATAGGLALDLQRAALDQPLANESLAVTGGSAAIEVTDAVTRNLNTPVLTRTSPVAPRPAWWLAGCGVLAVLALGVLGSAGLLSWQAFQNIAGQTADVSQQQTQAALIALAATPDATRIAQTTTAFVTEQPSTQPVSPLDSRATQSASSLWSLYPLAVQRSQLLGASLPVDPYTEYNFDRDGLPVSPVKISISFSDDSITVKDLFSEPVDLVLVEAGIYAARINEHQEASETLVSTLVVFTPNPDEIWVARIINGPDWEDRVLMLSLPGERHSPDPRQNGAPNCPGAHSPRLIVGEQAQVIAISANTLRAEPDKLSEALGMLQPGTEVTVLDGPICASDFAYWKVSTGSETGWTADSHLDQGYWLLPKRYTEYFNELSRLSNEDIFAGLAEINITTAVDTDSPSDLGGRNACPGNPKPRLKIGSNGRVLPGFSVFLNSLPARTSLNPESVNLARLTSGDSFTVLDGPTCADGITWWRVTYEDDTGWMGESQETYWVEPVE